MNRDCAAKDYSQHVVKPVVARLSLKTRRCNEGERIYGKSDNCKRRVGAGMRGQVLGSGSGCRRDGVEHEWFAGWIAAN